jgi:hypothetical protein
MTRAVRSSLRIHGLLELRKRSVLRACFSGGFPNLIHKKRYRLPEMNMSPRSVLLTGYSVQRLWKAEPEIGSWGLQLTAPGSGGQVAISEYGARWLRFMQDAQMKELQMWMEMKIADGRSERMRCDNLKAFGRERARTGMHAPGGAITTTPPPRLPWRRLYDP